MLTFDYDVAHKLVTSGRQHPACLSYHEKVVGGLSKPSKMPWYSWSIPATACKTGSVLRGIENSVCSKCYAMKGRYGFRNVRDALNRRLGCYRQNPARWAASMVLLLEGKAKSEDAPFFRWFDSGDVQDFEMLQAIVWIATQLPQIRFWLPTKESALMRQAGVRGLIDTAPNLTVRVSAPMIGQVNLMANYATSSVGADGDLGSAECPAKHNNGQCGDCRMCWQEGIENVNYTPH